MRTVMINPSRKRKILIVFDGMIADIMSNKIFQSIIKDLFIRCRKLNISLVFITRSYFSVPKDVDYKDFMTFTENAQENLLVF